MCDKGCVNLFAAVESVADRLLAVDSLVFVAVEYVNIIVDIKQYAVTFVGFFVMLIEEINLKRIDEKEVDEVREIGENCALGQYFFWV